MARTCADLHVSQGAESAREAARLFAQFEWAQVTWRNCTSQLRKWLICCDEEGRQSLPAGEGDSFAYIGFLPLEINVSSRSARHYVGTVSGYHEDAGLLSPTKILLVSRLLVAFKGESGRNMNGQSIQTGNPAGVVCHSLRLGLSTSSVDTISQYTLEIFAFMFACRSVTACQMTPWPSPAQAVSPHISCIKKPYPQLAG